ncbi:hypothetical protein [Schaedlerella sp.]
MPKRKKNKNCPVRDYTILYRSRHEINRSVTLISDTMRLWQSTAVCM